MVKQDDKPDTLSVDDILAPHSTAPYTIAGAGNWMISHDRIGPKVLELIEGRYSPEVELCDAGTAGLAMLDYIHGQEVLFVVDACVYGGYPGEVQIMEPDLDLAPTRETSVHQIGPIETMIVGKHLFPERMPKQVKCIMVETEGIDDDTEAKACQQVVAILDEELKGWRVPPLS